MGKDLFVLSADSIDRYGNRIHIKALEMMLKDRMSSGIPLLLGHDQNKPLGWGYPFALYLEPNLTRLIGVQSIPTTKEEKKLVLKNLNVFRSDKYITSSKDQLQPFISLLKSHAIDGYKITNVGCITANKVHIARDMYPFLFSNHYRDEVVPFAVLFEHFEYIGKGIFKDRKSDFVVFAHRFFRRSESIHNTLNGVFLDELIKLRNEPQLDLYLRIDDSQIGYAPSYKEYMELEYQWGPTYSDDIETIKEGMARHDCDEFERSFYGFSRSEFLWEWDKDKQKFSFQMEEVMDVESPGEDHFNCRYVHTVYDKGERVLEHFDGAVRTYDTFEMIGRLDKNIKSYGKYSRYTKLFKVNGKLPLSTWKLLVTLYLRSNPIIYEYFGLKKEVEELKSPQTRQITMKEHLVPYQIEKADGLRLLVSYFDIPKDLKSGRFINSFDILGDSVESYKCIDFYFLEFKKALMKLGENIDIPEDVLLIKSMDDYWNLPLIMHNGNTSWDLFNGSIEALKMLFRGMIDKEIDLKISITLGITMCERVVQVSAFGDVQILNDWISSYFPFPKTEDAFSEWLVDQRKYLKQFPYKFDQPLISEAIQLDGVLYAKRTPLFSQYRFKVNPIHGLEWTIDFNEQELGFFNNSGCEILPAIQISECVCSDTKENYFNSIRSMWIDNDLPYVEITKSYPVLLHWSSKRK